MNETNDTGMTGLPSRWVAHKFEVATPILFPKDVWGANMDTQTARCALVTQFKATIVYRDAGKGDIFFTTTLLPGEKSKVNVPGGVDLSKERRFPTLEMILDQIAGSFDSQTPVDFRFHSAATMMDTLVDAREVVARALAAAFRKFIEERAPVGSNGEIREEEVLNPNTRSCLTMFFHRLVQHFTLIISTTGFLVEIADKNAHEQFFPEEFERVAPKYFATGNAFAMQILARFRSVMDGSIARARDYRDRIITGLTRGILQQPYAHLVGNQLDTIDVSSGLDRPVITGCVVAVEHLAFQTPGYLVSSTVGPDCRSEHDRLADGAGSPS